MKSQLARLCAILSFALLSMPILVTASRADMVPSNTVDAPPAEIGGPMTKELAGLKLFYKYTTGREYELTFDEDTVTFLPHKDPTAPAERVHPQEPCIISRGACGRTCIWSTG